METGSAAARWANMPIYFDQSEDQMFGHATSGICDYTAGHSYKPVKTNDIDAKGVARYPVGILPVMDPATGETLVDELGRRSFTTSIAYGPTIGKNIALAYLPWSYCQEGRKLIVEYFGETYPVEVAGVGYKPLYDPENKKPRS